jgi:DNA-binding response OmpR family regulator
LARERADRVGRRRRGGDRGGGARATRERGLPVVVALDGPEAIEAHLEHQPDLVVLDLMLPGMDGLEVCKRIQRDRWTPVLMLTAKTEEADKVAGFAVGADDYLTKPFSLRELPSVSVRSYGGSNGSKACRIRRPVRSSSTA